MKILITGANGFIGKNLVTMLKEIDEYQLMLFTKENTLEELYEMLKEADFIFHLAGINRPDNTDEFYKGNRDLTKEMIQYLSQVNPKTPVVFTSSIKAKENSDYGLSKYQAEKILEDYSNKYKIPILIYRLNNVFGKWSQPNYNSVVATWCYNVSRNIPLIINDPNTEIKLQYIDDVIDDFILQINNTHKGIKYKDISPTYTTSLSTLKKNIEEIHEKRRNYQIIEQKGLKGKLYATYLSYLKKDNFSIEAVTHKDARGSFTELFKSIDFGQVSVNVSKPGITKGDHWHRTKNEKFVVVSGKGIIKFRNIINKEIIEYKVSDDRLEIVDIPPGYTHNIINTGNKDLVTIMWANEIFDKKNPDTYFARVD